MSELLTTHFAKTGRFDVVERARLYQLLNEKQIRAGQGLLGDQARVIGSELRVDAIVVGGYSRGSYGYELAVRIVATGDGTIMATENALVPIDPNWMDESMAVLAAKLSAPWAKDRGYVLDVFLETDKLPLLMIDLGTAQGADIGRELEVSTVGDPIIHPITKENLGTRDILLATAAIVQAYQEFSYARVMDRAGVRSTLIEANEEGIDIGIERMQRVKLLDETTTAADGDLSVLAVEDQLPVTCDIPDAKLLVDGEAKPLGEGSTSVRLGAGTHLVELQVERLLLSREVTVTKLGVRPETLEFRKEDLASAISVEPEQTKPLEGTTVVSRTDPQLSDKDQEADEKLLAMLPTAEEIEEQLRSARYETVAQTFEAGLRALRQGHARRNRSYLTIAANRFRDVIELAPDFALGHYNLGLASFELDYLDDAKEAFDQAVALEPALNANVPLLWWEDFAVKPRSGRIMDASGVRVENGVFAVQVAGGGSAGLHLFDIGFPWRAADVVVTTRFRVLADRPPMPALICGNARQCSAGTVDWVCNSGNFWRLSVRPEHVIGDDKGQYELGRQQLNLTPGWHIVDHELIGSMHRLFLDGELICEGVDERSADWNGTYSLTFFSNDTRIELDWVLARKP